jgi:serine/threonine-protein kinase
MASALRRRAHVGKYRLESRIGLGAFAEVWRARDTVENRPVALKVAFPEVVKQWSRKALEREARIATRLEHPNIVATRNADWIDGRFVIATDLAERNLADYVGARRSGRLALRIVRDAAAGLAYAHSHRLMHRDVKPHNILIFGDGRAALTDFGVSQFAKQATQTYTEAGTLGYMAPEQAYGRPKLGSDVFSLGLIAYELLTGWLPTWPFAWPPPDFDRFRAKVPEPVQRVLRKAAEFEPTLRYPDAVSLHQALEKAFSEVENGARSRSVRRRRPRRDTPSPLAVQWQIFRRIHGSALGMRFGCCHCGGPIAEEMRFCPWCGEGDSSFAELTGYPLICPECERGVRPEWRSCPWCFGGRFEGNGRAPAHDPKALRRCSRRGCGGQLRAFMRYCPLCKQKVRRPWSSPELEDRCKRCRWPVSRSFWRFCPWCGRRESQAGSFGNARR